MEEIKSKPWKKQTSLLHSPGEIPTHTSPQAPVLEYTRLHFNELFCCCLLANLFSSPCGILILPVICIRITIKWPARQSSLWATGHRYKRLMTPCHLADDHSLRVPCFLYGDYLSLVAFKSNFNKWIYANNRFPSDRGLPLALCCIKPFHSHVKLHFGINHYILSGRLFKDLTDVMMGSHLLPSSLNLLVASSYTFSSSSFWLALLWSAIVSPPASI